MGAAQLQGKQYIYEMTPLMLSSILNVLTMRNFCVLVQGYAAALHGSHGFACLCAVAGDAGPRTLCLCSTSADLCTLAPGGFEGGMVGPVRGLGEGCCD